ncbi:MAG: type-F conjugative transfer system pilin assembly protein TrbC [Chromatiales bacterium]|nr:type-F conjugative transfer system pilin assembly protein TrbC [Chromatiales bacterium]
MLRVLMGGAVLLVAHGALADGGRAPTAVDLDAARRQSVDAVEDARRALAAPGTARDPRTPPTTTAPHRKLPQVPTDALTADQAALRALLDQVRVGTSPSAPAPESGAMPPDPTAPLVFVSLSMPDALFRALADEAGRVGGTLVLRGLVDDSLRETVVRLRAVLAPDGQASAPASAPEPAFAIDPTLFQRFAVAAVPTFVLPLTPVAACDSTGCPVPEHVRLAGSVSLRHALGVIARDARDPMARDLADALAARLGAQP